MRHHYPTLLLIALAILSLAGCSGTTLEVPLADGRMAKLTSYRLFVATAAQIDLTVENVGGCTAVLSHLAVTNPDGTVTQLPTFVLAPEESTTLPATWRVPEIPMRDEDGETDAQYQARLEGIDGSDLTFLVELDWSDPGGAFYGPTSGEAHSTEILSIVPVTLSAPATAEAGTTITYLLTATNVGSAAAPESWNCPSTAATRYRSVHPVTTE